MDWRSHAIIGALFAAIVFYLLNAGSVSIILLAIFAGFSALLPDIDHDSSKIRKITDSAFILFSFVYSFFSCPSCDILSLLKSALILIGLYFLIISLFKPKHRGITHSLLFVLIYALVLYLFFGINLAIAGFIGYLSHLVADNHIKLF